MTPNRMDMRVERRVSYTLEVQDKIVVIEVPAPRLVSEARGFSRQSL